MANEKLKKIIKENINQHINEIIALLPTDSQIDSESMKHDTEYMSETFFAAGAKWMKEEIIKKLSL